MSVCKTGRRSDLPSKEYNVTELRLWCFKFSKNEFGVIVQGFIATDDSQSSMQHWTTTPITRRISETLLETGSGNRYRLDGNIDEKAAIKCGYSNALISLFKKGFPSNWEKVLREYHTVVLQTNAMNASKWFDHTMASSSHSRRKTELVQPKERDNKENSVAAPVVVKDQGKRKSRLSNFRALQVQSPIIEETEKATPTPEPQTPTSTKPDDSNKSTSERRVTRSMSSKPSSPSNSPALRLQPETQVPNNATPRRARLGSVSNAVGATKTATPAGRARSASVSNSGKPKTPTPRSESIASTPKSVPKSSTRRSSTSNTPKDSRKESTSKLSSQPEVPVQATQPTTIACESTDKSGNQPSEQAQSKAANQIKSAHVEVVESDMSAPGQSVAVPAAEPVETAVKEKLQENNTSLAVTTFNADDSIFKVPSGVVKKKPNTAILADPKQLAAKAIVLTEWKISFVDPDKKVPKLLDYPPFQLAGRNSKNSSNGDWYSSVIVRVVDLKYFLTISGSVYTIEGDSNLSAFSLQGFTKEFSRSFHKGFPENWIELLNIEYRKIFRRSPISTRTNRTLPIQSESNIAPIVTHPTSDTESSGAPEKSVYRKPKTGNCDRENDVARFATSINRDALALVPSSNGSAIIDIDNNFGSNDLNDSRRSTRVRVPAINPYAIERIVPKQCKRRASAYEEEPRRLAAEYPYKSRSSKKRKLVSYSDSSSDENDDFVKQMKALTNTIKRNRLNSQNSDSSDSEKDHETQRMIQKKIRRKRRKLERQIEVLDEYEESIVRALRNKSRDRRRRQIIEREDDFERKQERMQKKRERSQGNDHRRILKPCSRRDRLRDEYERYARSESESDSSSTETECEEGSDWRSSNSNRYRRPTTSKNPKRRSGGHIKLDKKRGKKIIMESDSASSDGNENHLSETLQTKRFAWKSADVERLKLVISGMNVRSDEDWERVSHILGDRWTGDECRQIAFKRLKWIPADDAEITNQSEEPNVPKVTARPGTMAFEVQRNNQYSKIGRDNGDKTNKILRETILEENEGDEDFDVDDDLLQAMKTPVVKTRKPTARREAMPVPLEDDSPASDIRRRSSYRPPRPDTNEEPDSCERERDQRYLHSLKVGNRGAHNTSRINQSRLGRTFDERSRMRNMDETSNTIMKIEQQIAKKMSKARRPRRSSDEFSDLSDVPDD